MRKLLIVVAVLALLAVVVDRVAEHLAEGEVASVVKEREDLPSEPDVEFHGFPFLTQVLGNDLSKVTMTLPEVEPKVTISPRGRRQSSEPSQVDLPTPS